MDRRTFTKTLLATATFIAAPVKLAYGKYFGYDAVGKREELADIIANLEPVETPFLDEIDYPDDDEWNK